MKFVQSAAVLSVLFPAFAMAEETKKDEKNVTPYGIIQSKYYLSDTSREAGPEAVMDLVRAGLRAKNGIALGGIELQFNGNKTDFQSNSNTGDGATTVRGAWLGVELPTKTTIKLGRVRPAGASGYGTDLTTTPQQYGGLDGARITQEIALPEDGKIVFGLGAFNSLRNLPDAGFTGKTNFMDVSWNKPEKSWLGSVMASYKGVNAHMWYGFERNAIIRPIYTTTQGTSPAADATTLNPNGLEVAAISHSEGSLGYDQDHFGFGVFFEQDILGKKKTANLVSGKLTTVADVADTKETTTTVAGAGANLNSKQFGITNMLQADDAFTAGIAFTQKTVRENGTSEASQKGNDVNELTASVSYTVGGLDLALGLINEQTSAKSADFAGVDGQPQHSRTRSYINAAWEF